MQRQNFGLASLLVTLLALATFNPTIALPSSRSESCQVQLESIICNGLAITDVSLLLLKDLLHSRYHGMAFVSLFVTDTSVTRIPAGTFADVEFENIYIQDNQHLTYISEDAFQKHKAKTLVIRNNHLLANNSVYRIADRLEVSEDVELEHNALVEIPSHAFNEHLHSGSFYDSHHNSHPGGNGNAHHGAQSGPVIIPNLAKKVTFKKVVISNNKIERVFSNAFHSLESCNQIYINYNQLKHIEKHGFNLLDHAAHATKTDDYRLQIVLHHNQLTSDSFEEEFIQLNEKTQLALDLSSNHITQLKKHVFKPLLETKNVLIDLTGNPLDCTSEEVKWLKEDAKIFVKTKGVKC